MYNLVVKGDVFLDQLMNNELYRLLLEQMPEGVIITDRDGVILFVNDSAEKIRNMKRESIVGENLLNCHKNESQKKVLKVIEYLKQGKSTNFHRMVTDERNQKVYENSYASIYDNNDNFQGIAVISRDITAHEIAEAAKANIARLQKEELDRITLKYHKLWATSLETLSHLLEERDAYTNGHSARVAELSAKLYEHKFGQTDYFKDIVSAAKLHDIGKICIPDYIIEKPGKLTDEEYEIVKRHSSIASDILENLDMENRVSSIVRHHHERFDGAGYPDGLCGTDIPLGARILAITDAFDAMSADRPYRSAIPFETCVEEIKNNAGTQFDPDLVEVFCELAVAGVL